VGESLNEASMLNISKELNLSETVFVKSLGESAYEMRVFSPKGEIEFAGHPIIATAYALGEAGLLDLTQSMVKLTLKQKVGDISVFVSVTNGKVSFVQFSRSVTSVIDRHTPTNAEIASMLGIDEKFVDSMKYTPRLVSCGFPYLIVPIWDYQAVRDAVFNYPVWTHSTAPQSAAEEILLFATKTPFQDANFNLRLVGPNIGIHEDPPVGNAIPAFASYLCAFESTLEGTHTFTVDRGDHSKRRSVLNIEMDNFGKSALDLRIGGEAVMMAKAELLID
jgi:trans-2,3-dihydro-3-hydroxyanthranilate isomerase